MQKRMEQFPATNPNPVLSARKDGNVLYSNVAGEPLLHEWGMSVGEKLPQHIENIVFRVISRNSPEKIEVKAENRVYSLAFHSLPKEECVNIYGFDITDQKELEEKLREAYENLQVQSEEFQAQSEEIQVQNEELQSQTEELQEFNEALRKSEEHYRMLFTNMTEAFYLTDIIYDKDGKPCDYRFLEVNPAYELNMGVKKEQMLGKSLLEVFPNVNPLTLEKYYEIAVSSQSENFEVFSQVANDKYLDIYAFSPEKGKLAVIFRDITERKQAEEKLRGRR
jgi:PAS domain S-box-containing protein